MSEKKKTERISQILKDLDMKATEFAEAIGVNVQNIYDIRSGKCKMSERVAEAIHKQYEVYALEWLMGNSDKKSTIVLQGDSSTSFGDNYFYGDAARFEQGKQTPQGLQQTIQSLIHMLEEKDKRVEWMMQMVDDSRESLKKKDDLISELIRAAIPGPDRDTNSAKEGK